MEHTSETAFAQAPKILLKRLGSSKFKELSKENFALDLFGLIVPWVLILASGYVATTMKMGLFYPPLLLLQGFFLLYALFLWP